MLPNFLIIGAPRAGTTWIDKNLRRHPDIFMPDKKELHFFDKQYDRGIAFYEAFFSNWSGQTAVGEATPAYLHTQTTDKDIPAVIHKHLPDIRLIVSLRNPVDRAYSRYLNSKAKFDHNAMLSFEEKLAARPEFIEEGFYYDHLRRYLKYFPKAQIHLVLYEDIAKDPTSVLHHIFRFLNVSEDFQSGLENITVNAALGKRNLAKSKPLWFLSRLLDRMGSYRWAEAVRQYNSVSVSKMRPETRANLIAIYREKNRRLEALIERDLRHWDI